ncbi:TPA_asm: polyprotein [Paris polyphylla secovirus 1]|uniref:Polyprotein n=1 Tax=Paris polyphylla secovirus 1 TaxID=2936690 RepID=A0A9N7AAP9_9SECO|nr:TPA_asm: polyprotein [Paris polyphylla secovirus 1]
MIGVCGDGAPPLPGCGRMCALRRTWSGRAFRAACTDGDLTKDGRCPLFGCGALVSITKGVQQPKKPASAKAEKCLCWVKPAVWCEKHQLGPASPKGSAATRKPRSARVAPVPLPYRKQTCDVVVACGPLELVYPALVSTEQPTPRPATPVMVEEVPIPELPLWLAPVWMVEQPYAATPEVPRLTQREEFALLRKRLTRKGKQVMRLARRMRLDAQFALKRARAATQRKVEQVTALVVEGRRIISSLRIRKDLEAETCLSPAQEEQVRESCAAAAAQQARSESFFTRAKAWRKKCSASRPVEMATAVVKKVVQATVPWAHLGIHVTGLRARPVVDGSLGAKQWSCRSIVATTFEYVATTVESLATRMARWFQTQPEVVVNNTRDPFVQQEAAPEEEDKFTTPEEVSQKETPGQNTSWQGCQEPEMGLRNIYVFHDDSWSTSPEEDDKYTIPWSRVCGSPYIPVLGKGAEKRNNITPVEVSHINGYNTSQECEFLMNPEEVYTNVPEVQPLVAQVEEDKINNEQGEDLFYPADLVSLASQITQVSDFIIAAKDYGLSDWDSEYSSHEGADEFCPLMCEFVGTACSELSSVSGDSYVEGCMYVYGNINQPYFIQSNLRKRGPGLFIPVSYYDQQIVRNKRVRAHPEVLAWNIVRRVVCGERIFASAREGGRYYGKGVIPHHSFQISPIKMAPRLTADEAGCEMQLLYNAMLALTNCDFGNDSQPAAEIENAGQSTPFVDGVPAFTPWGSIPVVKRSTTVVRKKSLSSLFFKGDMTCNSGLGNVHTVTETQSSGTEQVPSFTGTSRPLGSSMGAAVNAAPYQQNARTRWLGSRERNIDSQQDRIRRLADKQGISYEEARGAYRGATEAMPSQDSILPSKSSAYKRRSVWNRAPSTRAQSTVDVTLSGAELDSETATAIYYFNPVSQQEIQEMAQRGNTMISIDAVEIAIDPVGMPGDDTDLTVMLLWPQNSDPQRALIGAVSTFVGNGLARCVFFPGLKLLHEHCTVQDGRVLKIIVSSTNSTMLRGLPQAQISIGTLRQHLGSGHDRTITNDLMLSQIGGQRIGATQQGSATVFAPRGGAVEGTPSVNADIGAGSVLVRTGPLSWRAQRSQSSRFVVEGTSRARLSIDGQKSGPGEPIPIVRRQNNDGGVNIEEMLPPRYATTNSGITNEPTLAYARVVKCKQDSRVGHLLETIDIHNDIINENRLVAHDWAAKGLVSSKFKLRITVGSNPFVGVTLGITVDAFDRLNPTKASDLVPVAIALQLDTFLFPISSGAVFEREIDLASITGYNFFPAKPAFGRPQILIYILDDNSLPASDSWLMTLELFMTQLEYSPLATTPILTLPHAFSGDLPLNVWRGPFSFPLGGATRKIPVALDFGRETWTKGGHRTISQSAAYARLLQGHGGMLNGEVVKIGSAAVSCALHLQISYGEHTGSLVDALYLPGQRLPLGEGKFSIRIQTPYGRSRILDQDVFLNFHLAGGPIAVSGFSAPYQFAVRLDNVTDDASPPRSIGIIREFNWATIVDFKEDESRFAVPARLCDIILANAKVVMRDNPLALLIGSCGFFRGGMTITFEWSTKKKVGEKEGAIQLLTCDGILLPSGNKVHSILQSHVVSMPTNNSISRHISVEDFSGFAQSGGHKGWHETFVEFWCDRSRDLRMLNINVTLDEGFEIYGRSILPIRNQDGSKWSGGNLDSNNSTITEL